jgi:3-methyl-2-oxobutanoate hydroxymethyltransferase
MYTQPQSTAGTTTKADHKPVTVATLARMKQVGEKFAALTAYDASFAALLDSNGVEVVLVGDSLGMVVQGHPTTLPVTVDDILYHGKAVARGLKRALLMLDMPFMSYATPERALDTAQRFMQEGGAHMVKLEGAGNQREVVEYLASRGIPVCAHLGLRPQSVHKLGGFRVQGRDSEAAREMLEDAQTLEAAGADIILLELVPKALAKEISETVAVPVIGIGAGVDCDGQILVTYDMLDITPGRRPKFVRNFMDGASSPADAVQRFVSAVKDKSYPGPEHSF